MTTMRHSYYQHINRPDSMIAVEQDGTDDCTGYQESKAGGCAWVSINTHVLRNYYTRVSRKVAQKNHPELFKFMKESNAFN